MFQRYAIYVAPDGPLGRFGAVWLGWDIRSGQPVAHPEERAFDVAAVTARPRRYGFHATIKPPFRLAEGQTAAALETALGALCAGLAPVTISELRVIRMGRFLALTPFETPADLNALAASVVRGLDGFRAAPDAADLARRRAARLTPAQDRNLREWGYPHVMEQFRFHLTLTGRLDREMIDLVQAALATRLEGVAAGSLTVAHLSLVGEDGAGLFHEIRRVPLTGAA